MTDSKKKSKDIVKYAYIDSMRGFAVLGVLLVHTFQKVPSQNFPAWLSSGLGQGARGVQLFYIVSALTLFLSMHGRKQWESNPIRNFFIRRFFRIAPLFYIAIAYYLLQDGFGPRYWLGDAEKITSLNVLSTATFTNGLNPYWITSIVPGGWTIAVEMMFYLCLPFLFRYIDNLKKAVYALIGSLILLSWLNSFLSTHVLISDKDLWNNYLFLFFPSQLPVFLLGIILYFVINSEKTGELNRVQYSRMLFISSLFLIVYFSLGKVLPQHILFSLGLALGVYSLYVNPIKIIVNKATVHLGKVSFSMYLTHFALLKFIDWANFTSISKNEFVNFAVVYFIVVLLCAAVSTITYSIVEVNGQNLGKKIIQILGEKKADYFSAEKLVSQQEVIRP